MAGEGRPDPVTPRAKDFITSLAFRSDGEQAIAIYRSGLSRIIDMQTQQMVPAAAIPVGTRLPGLYYEAESLTLTGATWYMDCLAVARTGSGPRIVSGSRDKTVRICSPEHEEPLLSLTGHPYTVSDVQVMPGGERMVSCGGKDLRLWNLLSGECEAVYTADAHLLSCVPLPDGTGLLASDLGGQLHFLQLCEPR